MGCGPSKLSGKDMIISGNRNYQSSNSFDDLHLVALTSSSYGFLKLDPTEEANISNPDPSPNPNPNVNANFTVEEVLTRINSLGNKPDSAGPQSWTEVSNMLQHLKPELYQSRNPKLQPDTVDINDVMKDLDEDTGLPIKPKFVLKKAMANYSKKSSSKTLPFHTVEELDRFSKGGKENHVTISKNGTSSANGIKPGIDQSRLHRPKAAAMNGSGDRGDVLKKDVDVQKKKKKQKNDAVLVVLSENATESSLFDADFLGSYKSTLTDLSEDDWKAIEAANEELRSDEAVSVGGGDGVQSEVVSTPDLQAQVDDDITTSKNKQTVVVLRSDVDAGIKQQAQVDHQISKSKENLSGGRVESASLEGFERICPPGGENLVVLYTTSLKRIKKIYEDCIKVKEILWSLLVDVDIVIDIDERDVSAHLEYRNELRELLQRVVTVPRLFINGRYIGGLEQVSNLHKEGKLAALFR